MKALQYLTLPQVQTAAATLECEPEMVLALVEVELGPGTDGPFLRDGRSRILYERYWFHKLTGGRWSAKHPEISNKVRGGYGAGGAHQWTRLEQARALDEEAALMSASWGLFQILGANYRGAGFATVADFVAAMHHVELPSQIEGGRVTIPRQLDALVAFCLSKGLEGPMRRREFAAVARLYNGPKFAASKYDERLALGWLAAREYLDAKKPGG
jgi:hypothetical protein